MFIVLRLDLVLVWRPAEKGGFNRRSAKHLHSTSKNTNEKNTGELSMFSYSTNLKNINWSFFFRAGVSPVRFSRFGASLGSVI